MINLKHADSLLHYFFFTDTATTQIYTLSLHDALPISGHAIRHGLRRDGRVLARTGVSAHRSEEHTSELQSRQYLVCRLLLEKKKARLSKQTVQDIEIGI